MGRRDHGRLVHEVRDALTKRGFKPYRIIQLETPEGLRTIRARGFKVQKHDDCKSVRLSYPMAVRPSTEEMGWNTRQALGCEQMRKLVCYNAALEQEGFTCIAINSRDPLAPYSLWRRVDGGRAAVLRYG